MDSLIALLGSVQGLPHGDCLLWETSLVWLHAIADAWIVLAYYAISLALVYFVRQRRDVGFRWMILLFAACVFAGGTTHLLEIWTLWQPVYWLEGLIKTLAAVGSVATAVLIILLIPEALVLHSPALPASASHTPQAEVAEGEPDAEPLGVLINALEQRVEERTAALIQANQALQAEMAERQRMEGELAHLRRELQHRVNDFQTLLEVIPVGIAVAEDPQCRRVRANPWLSSLLGVAPDESVFSTSRPADHLPYQLCREGRELPLAELPMQHAAAYGKDIRDVEVDVVYRDGRSVRLLGYAAPLFEEDGQVRGCIGTYVDVTEFQRIEAQLRLTQHEKDALLREVHHRVKNNLQMVSSLLDLQADVAEEPRVRTAFEDSQDRIQAMALIHESLYQSGGLIHLNAEPYLRTLSQRLFDACRVPKSQISLTLETQPVTLPPQAAVPFGLLLNELLSNALKHAFPGHQEGAIHIALRQEPHSGCALTVRDTGVGFPADLDVHQSSSLGLQLVDLLAEQLGGTIILGRDGGTSFTVTLPV